MVQPSGRPSGGSGGPVAEAGAAGGAASGTAVGSGLGGADMGTVGAAATAPYVAVKESWYIISSQSSSSSSLSMVVRILNVMNPSTPTTIKNPDHSTMFRTSRPSPSDDASSPSPLSADCF